ncbi:TIGR04222 domain-containing membrane protein [Streptomyces sp. MS06]|uniref:TIGR04222 domain-containing membrane protein n=1 Tax=Streptomyces sp. MS06 TaxID=3385974 RepID=UPI0039A14E0F
MLWLLFLLPAWVLAGTVCTRLCLSAARATAVDTGGANTSAADTGTAGRDRTLTLYEAAFLAGGPTRVADLTLVSMARQGRLLLAHTGWATVVDPHARDDMELSVLGAIGPQGQSRIAPVRSAAAAADAVGHLADRLVRAGLAAPDGDRASVAACVRQARAAAVAVAVTAAAALLGPAPTDVPRTLVALWFALPLVLTLGCLAMARAEVHPYPHWASPAGQRLLGALARQSDRGDERDMLAAVAVRGIRAIGEPELRAAFAHREHTP